jgi:hypothetical protein
MMLDRTEFCEILQKPTRRFYFGPLGYDAVYLVGGYRRFEGIYGLHFQVVHFSKTARDITQKPTIQTFTAMKTLKVMLD